LVHVVVVVDAMLGTLAKRLRLAGVDVIYGRSMGDEELLTFLEGRDVFCENGPGGVCTRLLFSRDRGLVAEGQSRGLTCFLAPSGDLDSTWEWAVGVIKWAVGRETEKVRGMDKGGGAEMEIFSPGTRCSRCNSLLDDVPPHLFRGSVPDNVAVGSWGGGLWRCPTCGRFYWAGTHWDDMKRYLAGL